MAARGLEPLPIVPSRDRLRLATAGSVDDGKSTLIGRLLHDSRAIADDQLAAIEQASRRRGGNSIDLALLTDGLRAEREQGITIDVAYRYFSTPRRHFVLADTPGHIQYTRNMVTGASTADVAIVLVDARHGVVEQTQRHAAIAALLRVPHMVVAVNKMDLVTFDEATFSKIAVDVAAIARRLGICETTAIPLSALHGDNVVERSRAMAWYEGPPLLEFLETVALDPPYAFEHVRFPVQWVIRPSAAERPDYRSYAGRIEGGVLRPGDAVRVLPSDIETRIRSVDTFDGPLDEAGPRLSVAVRLKGDFDLGRGAMLVGTDDGPTVVQSLDGIVCWLGDEPLQIGTRYALQHTTRTVRATVEAVPYRLDVSTLEPDPSHSSLGPNDIGRVRLRLTEPIFADPYQANRSTGSGILIDEARNATVGALLVQPANDSQP